MKKTVSIITCLVILTSCGSNEKSKRNIGDVTPQSKSITGYLSNYLEIVEGTYKAEKDDKSIFSWIIKVKVKAKAKYDKPDFGFQDGNRGPLSLDFYDDKEMPLVGFDNLESDFISDSKILDILKSGSGETWITFTKFSEGKIEKYPENITSFTINSTEIKDEKAISKLQETDDDSKEEITPTKKKVETKDWDKVLDDYEDYLNKFVDAYREAKEGDENAIAEYPRIMKKALKLTSTLQTAKDKNSLSEDQVLRLTEISVKMMYLVSEVQQEQDQY